MRVPLVRIKDGQEQLTSHSGLFLIGEILSSLEFSKYLDRLSGVRCRDPKFSHSQILATMLALISVGKPDFDAVELFREGDSPLIRALGMKRCPSSPTLRQRIDQIGSHANRLLTDRNEALLRQWAPAVSPISTPLGKMVPLDIDVTPFDNSNTKKEGVSCTYKKSLGFAPIMAYLGTEGYLIHQELREGSTHCQKGTPAFLEEVIARSCRIAEHPILVRMDGGNDSQDNFDLIHFCSDFVFIVKRNPRRESERDWIEMIRNQGCVYYRLPGETCYIGTTYAKPDGTVLPYPVTYRLVEKDREKGQLLLDKKTKLDTWWCNEPELPPEEVIALYKDHGTSEQFHSELKSDMDLERLPSQRFDTNSLILTLGMLAYNMLRIIGQIGLEVDSKTLPGGRKKAVKRRRIRTVLQDLIYMAGRIIISGRRCWLSLGKINPLRHVFEFVYERLKPIPV